MIVSARPAKCEPSPIVFFISKHLISLYQPDRRMDKATDLGETEKLPQFQAVEAKNKPFWAKDQKTLLGIYNFGYLISCNTTYKCLSILVEKSKPFKPLMSCNGKTSGNLATLPLKYVLCI
jgi:hypothetical protein